MPSQDHNKNTNKFFKKLKNRVYRVAYRNTLFHPGMFMRHFAI